jgi:hypothetical protein
MHRITLTPMSNEQNLQVPRKERKVGAKETSTTNHNNQPQQPTTTTNHNNQP